MFATRRSLLRSATLAGGGVLLPGCTATTARVARPRGAAACLAPVDVAADRVIRTVAGLRPYRRSGFVVRAEPFGAKRLVHNYGHGGSGITLGWGTSRLATNLGLPGHQGAVAVLGSGFVGLTTARLVQEAGFAVTLYTAALPPETTSNIAGGQWHIASLYDDDAVTPAFAQQLAAAQAYGWRRAQLMTGDDYGIRWLPTWASRNGPGEPDPYEPGARWFAPGAHPFPDAGGMVRYSTMYAETGRLLRQLTRDVQVAGGRFVVRRFDAVAQVAELPETLVFNCTGLGARALFGDAELTPVRGQLAILLPQPEVDYAYNGDFGYMFPRSDGILLGGSHEAAETTPERIARILTRHRRVFGAMRCA